MTDSCIWRFGACTYPFSTAYTILYGTFPQSTYLPIPQPVTCFPSSFLFPSGFFFVFCLVLDICFCDGRYCLFQFLLCAHPSIIHQYTQAYSKIGNVTPRLWLQYGCPKSGVKRDRGCSCGGNMNVCTVQCLYQTYLPSPDVSHTPSLVRSNEV